MYEIRHYLTSDAKDIYLDWMRKQRNTVARIAIDRCVNGVEQGNFGDHKFCRDGVWKRALMQVLVTGFIMPLQARKLFCFCVVATSEHRIQIYRAPVNTGATG